MKLKLPAFTGFNEKIAYLARLERDTLREIERAEARSAWARADDLEDLLRQAVRELNTTLDDAQVSIPRHQR